MSNGRMFLKELQCDLIIAFLLLVQSYCLKLNFLVFNTLILKKSSLTDFSI